MESLKMSTTLPASPETIYNAWLSSEGHTAMTGSPAEVEAEIGGAFKAWDGYIWGMTLEMESPRRILQDWRTSEFPEVSPDSRVEIRFEESDGETKITLTHTEIPDGQGDSYKQGWEDFYFTPMRAYFEK
jgi:activator of HSP90 ATPase